MPSVLEDEVGDEGVGDGRGVEVGAALEAVGGVGVEAVAAGGAADGGGIANSGATVIVDSSIDGNAAWGDGGGIFNTGALDLVLSNLSGNFAGTDGGGLYNRGTAALVFSTVDDNTASAGGGIYADALGEPVVLIDTGVWGNNGGNISGRVIRM